MNVMPISDQTKDVFNMLKNGNAFTTSSTTVVSFKDRLANLAVPSGDALNGLTTQMKAQLSDIQGKATEVSGKIPDLTTHVGKMMEDLPEKISVFAAAQGLKNSMSGASGCGDLHDWFGSITGQSGSGGNGALTELSEYANGVLGGVGDVTNMLGDLQTSIGNTKSSILSGLNAELATETDDVKIAALNDMISKASDFETMTGDLRSQLASQAGDLLSTERQAAISEASSVMTALDGNIASKLSEVSGIVQSYVPDTSKLLSDVGDIDSLMENAMKELTTLGQASSLISLCKSNQCVQTLLGYVGTDDLLSKLK